MLPLSQDEALTLVHSVLNHWGLTEVSFILKAQTQNWVFQVNLSAAEVAILRVKPTMSRKPTLEHRVLSQINAETNLAVPRVLHIGYFLRQGSNWEFVHSLDSMAEVWEACLFAYVAGENRTPQTLSLEDARQVGAFLAHLHTESRRLILPESFDPQINADGLLGNDSRYASSEEKDFLSSADQFLLAALRQRLADIETLIGANSEHTLLLHGDFLLQNIVFEGETVGALDFEMCGWGVDLYDLATFLWQIKSSVAYEQMADALWQGYTFWRELPPRECLEIFIAARQGASVRWLIQNRHLPAYAGRIPALIRQRLNEIAAFLETGVLKRA